MGWFCVCTRALGVWFVILPRMAATTRPFRGVLRRHLNHPDGLPEYHNLSKPWLLRDTERWWLLDCSGQQLYHVARVAAVYATAQHRPDFRPGLLNGDQVVLINCKDVVLTGDQWIRTPVTWQTQWHGGRYRLRMSDLFNRDPCMLVWNEIRREVAFHFDRALKTRVAPLENVWLYENAVHPHNDKGLRPLSWNPSPFYTRYRGLQRRRWQPNEFMQ